jgi:NADH-quinone oxidoreductase subunit L
MTFPLIVLGVLAAVGGFVGIPHLIHGAHALEHWLSPNFGWLSHEAGGPIVYGHDALTEIIIIVVSVAIGIAGWLIARAKYHVPADRLPVAPVHARWHRLLTNKYWVDEFYDAVFVQNVKRTANFLYKVVDVGLIDGIFVRGTAKLVALVGWAMRGLQNGDVQAYVTVLVVGLTTALLFAACAA